MAVAIIEKILSLQLIPSRIVGPDDFDMIPQAKIFKIFFKRDYDLALGVIVEKLVSRRMKW